MIVHASVVVCEKAESDVMTQRPFVLIHSPLVGTLTWQPVADILRTRGVQVVVPALKDSVESDLPYWQQEVESVNVSVRDTILVGHSGAGALLPALSEKLNVYGCIFVDAVLQFRDMTRLELMASEDVGFAKEFQQYLEAGGTFPNWTDEHLQRQIPDAEMRNALLQDIRPRGLDFFTEQIDVPAGWDTKPCAYLQLSAFYATYANQAAQRGWPVIRRDSHHFEILTQPKEIADLLLQISEQL